MWLIFSDDCISSNLDLSLIIHLQRKHCTVLMLGTNGILFLHHHGWKNTAAVTNMLEEKIFLTTSDLSGLFANACYDTYHSCRNICHMTDWLHFCRG